MQVVAKNGQLTASKAKVKVPSGLDTEVYNAWTKANKQDAIVPYLDWATPTMYDTITAAIQELHRRQEDAVVVREDGPVRLREVPQELSLAEQNTEPASAALALRKPARLRRRDAATASSRRASRAGSPTSTCCRRSPSTPRSCSPRSGTRSGSRCTQWDGLTPATWVGPRQLHARSSTTRELRVRVRARVRPDLLLRRASRSRSRSCSSARCRARRCAGRRASARCSSCRR